MFFKTKRNPRKTTRQTLSTEQLEPKAMFSVSPVEPVVALDVGPVNQAGYSCESAGTCSDPIWTTGGASTLRVGADSIWTTGGPSTLHIAGVAGPDTATSLRSENRFVFEMPNNDSGISLHASANPHAGPEGFMKLGDIKGEFRQTLSIGSTAGPGGSTFMTGGDGRSIVHPNYNVGEDGRSIVHPQFNVGEDGRSIVHPSFNVGLDGYIATTEDANEASFNVGEDGRSIVHPNYNVGNNGLAQANQQPHLTAIRDVDVASESIIGSANPGGDDVFMPKPNRTDVWTNGSATSLAPRHAAFAMMGR